MFMKRFAVYMIGLLIVVAALFVLITQTGLAQVIPLGILAAALVIILGIGVMSAATSVDEHPVGREITETRQQVGDTEIRRSKLE